MTIGLEHYLVVSAMLFALGLLRYQVTEAERAPIGKGNQRVTSKAAASAVPFDDV